MDERELSQLVDRINETAERMDTLVEWHDAIDEYESDLADGLEIGASAHRMGF